MDFDWKALIKTVAPGLASMFGTPLSGVAVKAIGDALLPADQPRTEEAIAALLQAAAPDVLVKIRTVEAEIRKTLAEAGIKLEELANQDRANARERQSKSGDQTPRNLAYLYTFGYFVFVACVLFVGVEQNEQPIVNSLIGILSAAQLGIINYFFGASHGEQRKAELSVKAEPVKGAA